jgi:hypothetical protein
VVTHNTVTALSGTAWCLDCDWDVDGVSERSALILAAAHANAPEGHSVDGCEPVMTDCCDVPRWECQTFVVLDSNGDPDVRSCVADRGCRA